MNLPKYKGKRIRASDKSLVYRFSLSTLLLLFVAVVLLLNLKQLMRTDWEQFKSRGKRKYGRCWSWCNGWLYGIVGQFISKEQYTKTAHPKQQHFFFRR